MLVCLQVINLKCITFFKTGNEPKICGNESKKKEIKTYSENRKQTQKMRKTLKEKTGNESNVNIAEMDRKQS